MTYQLTVPPSLRGRILDLPADDRAEILALFDRLTDDPEQATGIYGQHVPGPVQMRTAGLTRLVVIVLVNEITLRVTVIDVVDPLA